MNDPRDYIVACVMATEVPPVPTKDGLFTDAMIIPALQAVKDCIMARMIDSQFPRTAVGVVMEKGQFSAVCREDYWVRALEGSWAPDHVARALMVWENSMPQVAPGALFYFSPCSMVPRDTLPGWDFTKLVEIETPAINKEYFRFFKRAA